MRVLSEFRLGTYILTAYFPRILLVEISVREGVFFKVCLALGMLLATFWTGNTTYLKK